MPLGLATTGLTQVPANAAPLGYVIIFAGSSGCELASVDVTSGATTAITSSPTDSACVNDLAFVPGGTVSGIREEISYSTVVLVLQDRLRAQTASLDERAWIPPAARSRLGLLRDQHQHQWDLDRHRRNAPGHRPERR